MSQLLVLGANPKRRKARKATSGKRRKSRSPAQRAATARMIAALGRNPAKKAAKRRSRRAAPAAGKRRSRRSFSAARAYSMTNIVPMLKNGAIAGAGGVANDILFGQVSKVLPDSVANPMSADGGTNYVYFGAKAATAIALGIFGRKLPVVGPYAGRMAEGALAVLSYQVMRPMVAGMLPASMAMGAFNPVPLMRPNRGMRGLAAYTPSRRLGAYVASPNVVPFGGPQSMNVPAKKLA